MSLAADSPVQSSSSDDFASILDAELASTSSEEPINQLEDDSNDECLEQERIKRRKMDKPNDIVESIGPLKALPLESDTMEVSVSKKMCPPHPGFIRDMCIVCGQVKDGDSGIAFGYIHEHLRLGSEEIARLRAADLKNLLRDRKLRLVLDLDHTLLNSTRLVDVSPKEEYLKQGDVNIGLYKLENMHMLTKLRPFVHTFLKEVSTMFDLYVYTMAERSYALEIVKILDPRKVYFNSGVISQGDSTQRHQKGLDVVLGTESAVIILDDTEMVWQKHRDNLILMERYHYFASSCRQFGFSEGSLSEMKQDESETDGALATVLKVLKQAHQMFFDPDQGPVISHRDVRLVLKTIRGGILKGCKLVFSHVFPTSFQAENHHLWKMAEEMGAVCSTEVDPSVTHVVSMHTGTEKARWAVKEKKFLVHPRWVEAANYMWKRQPEEQFEVPPTKSP